MPATTPKRITSAIATALAATDTADFDSAVAELKALDQSRLTLVLAGIIRQLLEILHPDGLDADDVQNSLNSTVRAASWYSGLQPEALAEVLLGALGLLAPEETRWAELFPSHAVLLISALLPGQPNSAAQLISHELAEIERSETMEMP